MKKFKLKLWLSLIIIGLLGVASLLLSDLLLQNLPEKITNSFSLAVLKLIVLVNPAVIVILMTGLGTLLYDKVNFSVPIFEKLLNKPDAKPFPFGKIIGMGCAFGIIAGVLLTGTSRLFEPYLPPALTDASQNDSLNVVTRIFYGGVTEELLTRFGLMSLFAWILFKLGKRLNGFVYWTANILSAGLFAMGHLPIVFQLVPEPTPFIYAYILIGNSIGGLIFGYAYWKKGLESAFIAHAVAHLTMIALALVFV